MSVVVVSVGVEVVSFEQEAKVTKAAIINRFFMCFINIYFLIFVLGTGIEPVQTLLSTGF